MLNRPDWAVDTALIVALPIRNSSSGEGGSVDGAINGSGRFGQRGYDWREASGGRWLGDNDSARGTRNIAESSGESVARAFENDVNRCRSPWAN